jgi:hypothetical protein
MACWALNNWDSLASRQDWFGWKLILTAGLIVDGLALLGMFLAWVWLKHCSKNLDSHFKTVAGLSAEVQKG